MNKFSFCVTCINANDIWEEKFDGVELIQRGFTVFY